MSITTIFYLADVAKNLHVVCFIGLAILGFGSFLVLSVMPDMDEDIAKKTLKLNLILAPIFIVLLVFIPSKDTIYVYGGQQAIIEISKNKDAQEIVTLIKEITIKKLNEINKSQESK